MKSNTTAFRFICRRELDRVRVFSRCRRGHDCAVGISDVVPVKCCARVTHQRNRSAERTNDQVRELSRRWDSSGRPSVLPCLSGGYLGP
jgi:hypothetical protein